MKRSMTLLAVVAALASAGAASAEQRYADATGDAGAAPDLGQVTVSNDAGNVRFDIAIPQRAPAPDEAYLLLIDSDSNGTTGEEGADVEVFTMNGSSNVKSWNGSAWVDAPSGGTSVRMATGAGVGSLLVSLPRTLLGNTQAIRFVVLSAKFSGEEVVATDAAPGQISPWEYALVLTQCANGRDDDADGKIDVADLGCGDGEDDLESDDPYTLAIVRPTVTPTVARAGTAVAVKARVTQVETKQPVATGAVRCTAKVGAMTRRWAGQLVSGTATCRLTVPRKAKPSTVRGTVAVTSKSSTASAPFSFRTR